MSQETILYVEDNPGNRILIQRVLMAEGYNIVFAENGTEAIEYITKNNFDMILMDINLPDIDGYTLTGKIRQYPNFADIPILALTANVMKGDKEKSLEAGCNGYIQKPIDIDLLPGQIKQYLNSTVKDEVLDDQPRSN